jgi:hypothetical protein
MKVVTPARATLTVLRAVAAVQVAWAAITPAPQGVLVVRV